jgi:hypothetical protein
MLDLGVEIRSCNLVNFKVQVEVFDLLNRFVLFSDDNRKDLVHIILKMLAFGLLDQNLEVVFIIKLILIEIEVCDQ